MSENEVVGRKAELGRVTSLLDSATDGPAVLAMWGEAGIGKTTVWAAGVEYARKRGFTVLACRPASEEIRLSYAGLADLLAGVQGESFQRLAVPQRRGLDAALLRSSGGEGIPDQRAVAAGFLSVLNGLASEGPVLVAIDDAQWLDEPTRGVLEFGVRRCVGPIAVLVARRADKEPGPSAELCPRDATRQQRLPIGPLRVGALHRLISQRTGGPLPRRTLHHIARVSRGNPFFALELARSLRPEVRIADPGDLAAPPDSVLSVVGDRIGSLAPSVREALLIASALGAPRIDLVQGALEDLDVVKLLEVAEDAGVVELSMSGAVRFRHPLLAAGVYAGASPSIRRRLHRELSGIVDDPEERARHLALATIGPDPQAVEALDSAAAHARRRGAPISAAELLELAIGLGADEPARLVQAARDHLHAGDHDRARRLLEDAIPELEAGGLRAEAMLLLAVVRFEAAGDPAAKDLLEQALAEAAPGTTPRCSISFELAFQLFNHGDLARSLSYMNEAAVDAEKIADGGLLAEVLAGLVVLRFLSGQGTDETTLSRALELEDPERRSRVPRWPTLIAGLIRAWSFDLEEAHAALTAVRARCVAHGFESELSYVYHSGVSVACALGDIVTAERYVEDLVEQSQILMTDQARGIARTFQAELWAWVGRIDDARAAGGEALTLLPIEGGDRYLAAAATAALGMSELSAGRPGEAASVLTPAMEEATVLGIQEPQAMPFTRDLVDALIEAGRLDEAEPVIEQLEANGRRPDRLWSRATGARGRGLLLAARGQSDEALEAFDQALAAFDRLPALRYDRARTLLVLGRLQRRRNERRTARRSLEEAALLFDQVGAAQWARNARAALGRLGLKPGPSGRLTPTEQHVAELAASGLSNKEIAAQRFVSPRTVEAHLGRVYRKLGIRSRTALAHVLAERQRRSDT
jgi:DNA-binding CsgD family transcriptional regulator